MIGRIFVNEISPNATAIDFSTWPGQILDKDRVAEGFVYHKVLEILGIRSEVVDASRTMLLAGDTAAVKDRGPALRRQIGVVAGYGSKRDLYPEIAREHLGKRLGQLVDWLRELPADTPFSVVATGVTAPFAREANDPKELFQIETGTPWWLSQVNLDVRHERVAAFTGQIVGQE